MWITESDQDRWKIGLIQEHLPLRNGDHHPRQIDLERRYQLIHPVPILVKSMPGPHPSASGHSNTGKVSQIIQDMVCFSSRNFSPVLSLTHDTEPNSFPPLVQANSGLPAPTQLSPGVLSVNNKLSFKSFSCVKCHQPLTPEPNHVLSDNMHCVYLSKIYILNLWYTHTHKYDKAKQ